MVKFIHAADIHLDSPLRGLERYEGAPDLARSATRQALEKLVQLALEQAVDFVLLVGDLYDGDWRDYNTGLFFRRQMTRLQEAGIPVFMVRGNHDAASQIALRLSLPDNVREFSHEQPETVILENLGVALHGQGYAQRAVTENLARSYPPPVSGFVNIGLLHTALEGREGHEPYAPCTVDELVNKGYDYWALGHVHQREIVQKEPWIVYPGVIQGRHVREAGRKGCTLVALDHGRVVSVEHRDVDVLRWCRCQIDCAPAASLEGLLDLVRAEVRRELERAPGRPLALRFQLVGKTALDPVLRRGPDRVEAEIRAAVQEQLGDLGWVEKVQLQTSSPRKQAVQEHLPAGFLQSFFDALEHDPELVEAVQECFQELKAKVPGELFTEYTELNLEDPGAFRGLLREAQSLAEQALSLKEEPDYED
jgi:exonuclease SbcD